MTRRSGEADRVSGRVTPRAGSRGVWSRGADGAQRPNVTASRSRKTPDDRVARGAYRRSMPAEAQSRFVVPVAIGPRRLERFAEVLDADAFARLMTVGERAAAALAGRVVWCVNSTATGGGVAEMLRSLLAYTRGAGVDCRWAVLRGNPSFFTVTKRLHNRLHGDAGDGGPIGKAERDAYELVTGAGARELAPLLHAGDVVVLHDPQTAGMVPLLQDTGAHVIWRAHVGADGANRYVDEARRDSSRGRRSRARRSSGRHPPGPSAPRR